MGKQAILQQKVSGRPLQGPHEPVPGVWLPPSGRQTTFPRAS